MMPMDDGECSNPDDANRTIRIRRGLEDKREGEVCAHEIIHAAVWSLDEEIVTMLAENITEFLWRIGWRKVYQKPTKSSRKKKK